MIKASISTVLSPWATGVIAESREDLSLNPKNGWSYTGLATALAKQGQKAQAANVAAQATKAFTRSDIKITSAVL